MAYEEAGYNVMDIILMLILGMFLVAIGITLVNGIQKLYNSDVPDQLKVVGGMFSRTETNALKYKDMLSFFNSTAFKIAKWVADKLQYVYSLFKLTYIIFKDVLATHYFWSI